MYNQKTITQFIINSIEDSNNLLRLLNLIFKILIIRVHLRPIIKNHFFLCNLCNLVVTIIA
jgi:hypothetical protein